MGILGFIFHEIIFDTINFIFWLVVSLFNLEFVFSSSLWSDYQWFSFCLGVLWIFHICVLLLRIWLNITIGIGLDLVDIDFRITLSLRYIKQLRIHHPRRSPCRFPPHNLKLQNMDLLISIVSSEQVLKGDFIIKFLLLLTKIIEQSLL